MNTHDDPEGRGFTAFFFASKGPPQLLLSVLLLALSLGAVYAVVPQVSSDAFARINHHYEGTKRCFDFDLSDRPDACQRGYDDAQNSAAFSNFFLNLFAFLTSSVVGNITDTRGRKGVLVVGLALQLLGSLALVMIQLVDSMNPIWYFASYSCGGLVKWLPVTFAAISDVMPAYFKAPCYAVFYSAMFMGFILGPILAIVLNHLHVSIVALVMVVSSVLFALVAVPETLPEAAASAARARNSTARTLNEASPRPFRFGMLLEPVKKIAIVNRNTLLRLVALVAFINGMLFSADKTLGLFYFSDHFSASQKDIAVFFIIFGVFGILALTVLYKPLLNCLGEKLVVIFALICGGIENLLFGAATSKATVFIAAGFGGGSEMVLPTLSSIAANNVGVDEQGHMQGAVFSLLAVADALGPILLQSVYDLTENTSVPGPGTMFFVAAVLYVIAAGVALALPSSKTNSKNVTIIGVLDDNGGLLDREVPLLDDDDALIIEEIR